MLLAKLSGMGIESIPVPNVMTRNVITEAEDQNIQAVCKIMNENNIGSVIIVKVQLQQPMR